MCAEIIAIGSEITSGAKLDTNSQWLSTQLGELGIPVLYHTTVADDLEKNIEVLRTAAGRTDLVLITGGLGPTLDDLTRDALAALAGVELELHPPSLEKIAAFFRGRGYEMPARNQVQAMFPAGSQPLANPIGTAPGIWMELPRPGRAPCLLAAMPGVPSEMYKMYFEQVRPRLGGGKIFIRRARINCFGIGESATEELLGDLTARGRDPEIGITAHEATITLRINAHGSSAEECQIKIDAASRQIREKLGDYVFGTEDQELEHVVMEALRSAQATLVTFESATHGLLAERLSTASRNNGPFLSGVVRPGIRANDFNGLRDSIRDSYILIIGEEIDSADASGSHIPIALYSPGMSEPVKSIESTWSGNPAITRSRTAKVALNLLRTHLRAVSVTTSPTP